MSGISFQAESFQLRIHGYILLSILQIFRVGKEHPKRDIFYYLPSIFIMFAISR